MRLQSRLPPDLAALQHKKAILNYDEDQLHSSIHRVAHDYSAGGSHSPNLDIEQLLILSKFRQANRIPTHHQDILPQKFSKRLKYPEPFEQTKIEADMKWYSTFGSDCNCSRKNCTTCGTVFDLEKEHLQKQLEAERYMRKLKKRIKKWRAYEERKLRGGCIWQRASKSVRRSWRGEPKEEPFDIDDLPRLVFESPDGSVHGQARDSESDTPRLSLTRVRAREEKENEELTRLVLKYQGLDHPIIRRSTEEERAAFEQWAGIGLRRGMWRELRKKPPTVFPSTEETYLEDEKH